MKVFIGKKIKILRSKNNLTQEELAAKCQLSDRFIRKIEQGNANYSLVALDKIIKALNETIYTFFKNEEESIMLKNEELIYNKTLNFCNYDQTRTSYLLENSLLLQYLENKTKALNNYDGDISKSRLSFGNLYAIYAVVENYIFVKKNSMDYSNYEGMSFSPALKRMRSLPGGAKLQNHAINSRCNDEFKKFFSDKTTLHPIVRDVQKQKYWIETEFINIPYNNEILDISQLILDIIDEYAYLIFKRLLDLINSIKTVSINFQVNQDSTPVIEFITSLLKPNIDARTFELVSFVILKYYYRTQLVYFGQNHNKKKHDNITNLIAEYVPELYKTGRTNANDGGIDYILKPLGKVFQVTEVLTSRKGSFNKYFLDIEKLNHYPITFVIKTTQSNNEVMENIKQDILSKFHDENIINLYLNCFEEIITIPDLINYLNVVIDAGSISSLLNELSIQTQLEFNMVNGTE